MSDDPATFALLAGIGIAFLGVLLTPLDHGTALVAAGIAVALCAVAGAIIITEAIRRRHQ